MIYEFPSVDAPLRQGDIFFGLPRVEISLRRLPVLDEDDEETLLHWRDIAAVGHPVTAILGVSSVVAIVATQDCDALHSRDITLCEICPFRDVERKAAQTTSPKKWKAILTQQARLNQKWFYLPPDERMGFADKMAVDFRVTLRIPRADLDDLRDLRRGRLNDMADEHFRERIAEFFRRYPYDEWYPLNREEMEAYLEDYPDSQPFPWQRSAGAPQESG